MKPLKLIMSAFGPYAQKQELDFSLVEAKNIFLVTGVTGAGKTTIFDAISYALFGEASGSSREPQSLRSHFAGTHQPTYVELTFKVKDEIYWIRRSPEQEVDKLRGEGTTIRAASVELQLPGAEKPLTKSQEVQERIREIVGVDRNQFRQIVMLPQGEFRRLLEAGSSERETIFRKIFGTQAFLSIQTKLREKVSELKEALRLEENSLGIYIKSLKIPQDHPLISKIQTLESYLGHLDFIESELEVLEKEDLEKVLKCSNDLDHLKKEITKLETCLGTAQTINKKITAFREAKEALSVHESKQEKVQSRQEMIKKAHKANKVKIEEDYEKKMAKQFAEREKALGTVKEALDTAKLKCEQAQGSWEKAQAQEPEKEKLKEQIQKLKPYKEKVIRYEESKNQLNNTRKSLEERKNEKVDLEMQIKLCKETLEQLQDKRTACIEASSKLKVSEISMEQKTERRQRLLELYQGYNRYFEMNENYLELEKEYKNKEIQFKTARSFYLEKEELFLKAQAGILAELLEEGHPCPVCGSREHPRKTLRPEEAPTEEALKQYEKEKSETELSYQKALQKLGEAKAAKESYYAHTLLETKKALENELNTSIDETLDLYKQQAYVKQLGRQVKEEIEGLKSEIEALKLIANEQEQVNKAYQTNEKRLEEAEKQLEKVSHILEGDLQKASALQESIRYFEDELPIHLRTIQGLDEELKTFTEKFTHLTKFYEQALERKNESEQVLIATQKDFQLTTKEYESSKEAWDEAKDHLLDALKQSGFQTYEQYQVAYQEPDILERLEQWVEEYVVEGHRLRAIYESLYEEAKELSIQDEKSLVDSIKEKRELENQLSEEVGLIKNRVAHNKEQLERIIKVKNKMQQDQESYEIVAELEKVAYGQGNNQKKMTFESYILTAYFDEIIYTANNRLDKMTSGRFELRRKQEIGKGNGRQGLELQVIDQHTGKARDVKTLSGGEGFKASLALALGLADVIQSHAGGISIDTMFIDEGFGTLDPASLDSAIECLLGLQQGGRLIGIISHVPELKERIEVSLEVSASQKGSQAKFVF